MRSSGAVTFGDVTYGPGGTCGPRVQTDYQLVLLYSGCADVKVAFRRPPIHIPAGSVGLLRPGRREFFRFSADAATHHGWCAVAPALVDATLAAEIDRAPRVAPFSSRLTALVRLGLSAGSPRSGAADRLVTQLGQAALLEFLLMAETLAPVLPLAARKACAYVDTHFAQGIDLALLSHVACVTPAHLIRLFNLHLGTTPMRHLWRVRAEAAMRLLRETGLSVGEIAERTGFQNPFHLSRVVKKTCQVSPRELRRRLWNAPAADSRDEFPRSGPAASE